MRVSISQGVPGFLTSFPKESNDCVMEERRVEVLSAQKQGEEKEPAMMAFGFRPFLCAQRNLEPVL